MNLVFSSGYLSVTEVMIRCKLLNKEYSLLIDTLLFDDESVRKDSELFYTRGTRSLCSKCKKKRTVRKDPFQWVLGLRCRSCMPMTVTYTQAFRLLRERKKSAHLLKSTRTLRKLSPYGRPMRLFLYADIIVHLKKTSWKRLYR